MKTTFTYGAYSAIFGVVFTLVLYLTGLSENFIISMVASLVIGVAAGVYFIVKGTKAVRETHPESEGFSYGKAWKAGFFVSIFSGLLMSVFNLVYFQFINPDFNEPAIQFTSSIMEKGGLPADDIDEQIEKIRADGTPIKAVMNGLIFGLGFSLILPLITGAFLKKDPEDDFSEADIAPPPLAD